MDTETTTQKDIQAAQALSRLFAEHTGKNAEIQIGTERIELPSGMVRLMLDVFTQVARGHRVSIVSKESTLTTAAVADLLNVSRPYVVQLLSEGKLPFSMVGTHRRVRLEDALQYRETQRQQSLALMQELSAEAQELGFGYEPA
jgi:excisionase family DNA binding protein